MSAKLPSDSGETASFSLSRQEIACEFAVLAILAIVITFGGSSTAERWRLEWIAWNWTPTSSDRMRPDDSLLSAKMEIGGRWSAGIHKSLTIGRRPSGDFAVLLSQGSCTGSCRLERVGDFKGGVLTLDRPLVESETVVYDTIYAMRVVGSDFLVPANRVEFVQDSVALIADGEELKDQLYGTVYVPSEAAVR